jgi:tol-pal system protein YbgF
MKSATFGSIAICLLVAFAATGCLKTRSQIRGNDAPEDNGGIVDARTSSATAKPANRYELEEIRAELTRLNGRLEEVDHTVRANSAGGDPREAMGKLEVRVAELEKNQLLVMSEVKSLKEKGAEVEKEAKESATPAPNLIKEGHTLLDQKKYDEASEKFKAVLSKGKQGKESAEAYYGLGEVEYAKKNYNKAILQYSKVQDASAQSTRIPSALLKIALSFQHMNRSKEAKGFFDELLDRFPKSKEAKKARAKMKE